MRTSYFYRLKDSPEVFRLTYVKPTGDLLELWEGIGIHNGIKRFINRVKVDNDPESFTLPKTGPGIGLLSNEGDCSTCEDVVWGVIHEVIDERGYWIHGYPEDLKYYGYVYDWKSLMDDEA